MKPTREAFHAWAQEHPGANLADARAAFPGLPESTLRRWFERRNEPPPTPPSPPPGRRGVAPVDELDPTQVENLVGIVRSVHATLRKRIAKIATGDVPVDRDEAAGLLSLARVASTLIGDHPGLLRAVSGTDPGEAPSVAEADVRKALGLVRGDGDEDG